MIATRLFWHLSTDKVVCFATPVTSSASGKDCNTDCATSNTSPDGHGLVVHALMLVDSEAQYRRLVA